MPVTLPIEVYETLEKGFGKEDAKKIIKSLETAISDITEYKWKVTKDELLDAIRKEFVTRELFEERINTLRVDLGGLRIYLEGKIGNLKVDLEGKIENLRVDLGGKIENLRVALEGKVENNKTSLEGKIEREVLRLENKIVALDRKFTIMFVVLFFTIIFLNQNALEFLARVLGLIK